MPEVAEWKFARGGWLQVYQLPERAGSGSCTLAVSDIEPAPGEFPALEVIRRCYGPPTSLPRRAAAGGEFAPVDEGAFDR